MNDRSSFKKVAAEVHPAPSNSQDARFIHWIVMFDYVTMPSAMRGMHQVIQVNIKSHLLLVFWSNMSLLKRKRQDTDDANLEKEVVPRQPSPIQSDSSDDSGSESDDVDDADAELKQKQPPMVASSSTTTALPEWFKRGRALASGTTAPVPLQTLGLPAAVLDVLRSQFRIQSWFAMQAEVCPRLFSCCLLNSFVHQASLFFDTRSFLLF
jgi:hypothetical protein